MSAFYLYVEEKFLQLDKRDRRIAEKRISDILFEIEMSADIVDRDLNCQQQNPYSGFNLGIPQQGQQDSTTFRDNLTWICLANDFLYFL